MVTVRPGQLAGGSAGLLLGLATVSAILVTGCGTSSTAGTPATTAAAAASASSTTASASAASSTAPGTGAAGAPTSCSAIPASVIAPYVAGAVTVTRQISATSHSVSCEFFASPTAVLILNIGSGGTPASFGVFERISGQGGRTTAAVAGLGASAFSIAKGGVPGGMGAISSSGVIFAVTSNNTFARDAALIRQLMTLY